eukprot:9471216-Pyramimonas_sp.AAC.1
MSPSGMWTSWSGTSAATGSTACRFKDGLDCPGEGSELTAAPVDHAPRSSSAGELAVGGQVLCSKSFVPS